MQITSEIFQVGGSGYTASEDAAIYLISCPPLAALIDAGCGRSFVKLARNIESDGLKVLFGQDVHGPLHPDLKSNKADYSHSLEQLLALKADILCEGHYGVFCGQDKVAEFIESCL